MQKRQSGRPRGLMGSGPSSVPSDTHPGCSGARGHAHLRRASDQFSYNPFPSSTPAQLLGAECCRFERSFGHKCFVPLSGTGQWTKSSPSFSFGSGRLLPTQPLPLSPLQLTPPTALGFQLTTTLLESLFLSGVVCSGIQLRRLQPNCP